VKKIVPILGLAASVALAGCATLRKDETVCPEYRELRCLTAPKCVTDTARGCSVCQCSELEIQDKNRDRLPSTLPPDSHAHPGP
jgi:hypothetical protein